MRIAELPEVKMVETRVVANVKLDIKVFNESVTAKIVSIPDNASSNLNRLYLRNGRMVHPWCDNEVIVSEAFAEAHKFQPGDSFAAIIN